MITQKLPQEKKIREEGVFLGYSLDDNYAECYRFKNFNWVLLDYYNKKTGQVTYIVARFYKRIGSLISGLHEIYGHPI